MTRRSAWVAVFIGLSAITAPAASQVDVSCPSTLRSRFDDYQPVVYRGKEFATQWQNIAGGPMGGPSYAWFVATPDPDPLSLDGTARWRNARILVHCFATRLWNGNRTYHYHPIAYNGTLASTRSSCGTGPPAWGGEEYVTGGPLTGVVMDDGGEPTTRFSRDPDRAGAPSDTYLMDCGGTGSGNAGGAGSMTCEWEYMTIEISWW